MRPEYTPRGTPARFLSPALVAPSIAPAAMPRLPVTGARSVTDRVEPHRLCLALLKMLRARDGARLTRGVDAVFVAAAMTLPALCERASLAARAEVERIHEELTQLPEADRVPVLLALAYALHESSPSTPPWRDVALALDAASTCGAPITAEHQRAAAAILAGVTL